MTKRHFRLSRALLFSGAMAFCLAPAMAQQHPDQKEDHEKTEHSDKGHHEGKGHQDSHKGGEAGHGGHEGDHGAAHGGGHDAGHDVGHAIAGLISGGHHGGAPERSPGHHFTYGGKSHDAFRGPAFHWPHGHGYHRPHVGWAMPLLFLTAQYILHDYGAYGLEPPPPGAAWVRYGPDIMLVDRHNGHVIKVIYGAFVE